MHPLKICTFSFDCNRTALRAIHAFKVLFLSLFQGTQSANPHNDYCQNFVDTGERPQNFIRDTGTNTSLNPLSHFRETPANGSKI